MREGLMGILVLLLLIIPMFLAYTEEDKVQKAEEKQIVDVKPAKEICNEHIKSGNKLLKAHQYEKALLDFKKALLYNPFSGKAYYGLGYCYKHLGLYDKAIKDLNIGIKYERSVESLTLLGIIYKYEGKYAQAKELFYEVLTTKPDTKEIINYLEEMEKVDKELLNTVNLK